VSFTVTTDVFCDGNQTDLGCDHWVHGVCSVRSDRSTARAAAREHGWVTRRVAGRRVDLCPHHASQMPEIAKALPLRKLDSKR
jgi:hypothetical protein